MQDWGLIAGARSITFAGIAFVVGVARIGNGSTSAVVTLPLFRRGTRITTARAHIAATNAIDAVVREALGRGRTRCAVVITTRAGTVAFSTIAFAVGIRFRGYRSARSISAATFFRGAARLAGAGTRRVATIAVDAIGRRALSTRYTRRSIRLRCLRLIAGARTIAFARITLVLWIPARSHGAANAVETLTFFRFGTCVAHARADIATAKAVHAIVGQTLRFVATRYAIVLLTNALAIACAAPAFFVGVLVVGYGAARSVAATALFGRGTRLTSPQTPTVATDAVGAITGCALGSRRAGSPIGIRGLRTRIARAGAITFAGIAFVVRIGCRFDDAANTIRTAAFFRG